MTRHNIKFAEFPVESMEILDFIINSNEVREILDDLISKLIFRYKKEFIYEVQRGILDVKNLTTDMLRDTVAEEIKHSPEPYNTIIIALKKEFGDEGVSEDTETMAQIEKKIYDHVYNKLNEKDLESAMGEIEEYLNRTREAKKMSRLKKVVAISKEYEMIYKAFETPEVQEELKRSFEKQLNYLFRDLSCFDYVDEFTDKLIEEVSNGDEPYNSVALYLLETQNIALDDDSLESYITDIIAEKVEEMIDDQVYEIEEKIEKFKSENESEDGERQEYWNSRL